MLQELPDVGQFILARDTWFEKVCGKIYIREVYKSGLTELKMKNASCLKGKKMGIRKCFLQGGD